MLAAVNHKNTHDPVGRVKPCFHSKKLLFLIDDLKMISGRDRGLPDILVPFQVDTTRYFRSFITADGDIKVVGKKGSL